jgi:hypothetical protein
MAHSGQFYWQTRVKEAVFELLLAIFSAKRGLLARYSFCPGNRPVGTTAVPPNQKIFPFAILLIINFKTTPLTS